MPTDPNTLSGFTRPPPVPLPTTLTVVAPSSPPQPRVLQGPSERPLTARVTVLSKVHYQIPGVGEDAADEVRYSERLNTEEQAYNRVVHVAEAWEQIDVGWVAKSGCSFLSLKNTYRPWRNHEPSPEEREASESRILEVGKVIEGTGGQPGVEPLFVLPLNFGLVVCPIGITQFRIRCRSGQGQYTVFAVPEERPTDE